MADRYTKVVLTIIAAALVYICIALTPLPSLSAQGAQQASKFPGQSTGPAEVVVVGWKQTQPMEISTQQPLRVVTERSSGVADRVVLVGYEELGTRERSSTAFQQFGGKSPGLPVSMR
jgi:hypothetical protein